MDLARWLLRVVWAVLLLGSLEPLALAAPTSADVAVAPVPRWVATLASSPSSPAVQSETGLVDVLHTSSTSAADVVWSTIVLDGKHVSAARVSCEACGRGQTRYFELAEPPA